MGAEVQAGAVAAAVADVARVLSERGEALDLADRLVNHCSQLLSAMTVGLLVEGTDGRLGLLAAASGEGRVIEMFQLQNDEGPCLDTYRSGSPTVSPTPVDLSTRWPTFASKALEVGIVAVHAVPVQVGGRTIGALNFFRDHEGALDPVESHVAHAMASLAAVGITHVADVAEGQRVRDQLQEALDSRVVLEQAKGILAERHRINPDDAFRQLRAQARSERRGLRQVAEEVVRAVPVAPPDGAGVQTAG